MDVLAMELGVDRHFNEEELESYSLGTASGNHLARLEEHLLICGSCQQRLEESDAYVRAIRSAAAELQSQPEPASRFNFFWRPALVFAMVVLVVGVMVVPRGPSGTAATPVPVSLQALRGPAVSADAPAGKTLLLAPDVSGLPEFASIRVEIVTAAGKPVWTGRASGSQPKPEAPPLGSGQYYVRLYSVSGELLREFGLSVR